MVAEVEVVVLCKSSLVKVVVISRVLLVIACLANETPRLMPLVRESVVEGSRLRTRFSPDTPIPSYGMIIDVKASL